jgi:hypothetical protein
MRILASHFAYTSNGGFIKYPLLYLEDNQCITEIEEKGNSFTESAGVEFFGGLMIPGFIVDLTTIRDDVDIAQLSNVLSRLYRDGVQYVILPEIYRDKAGFISNWGGKLLFKVPMLEDKVDLSTVQSPWQRIMNHVADGNGTHIALLLEQYLVQPWQMSGFGLLGGEFVKGKAPGVMVITGADWSTMQITKNTRIQRLHGC